MTQRGERQIEKLREEATCPGCEYSLRGLSGEVITCPECGLIVDLVSLLKSQWTGPWHKLPTFKAIVRPVFILMCGLFVGYAADGITNHKFIGLAISCFAVAMWGWYMVGLWRRCQLIHALKLSLLALVVYGGYFVGLFCVFVGLICVFMILLALISPSGIVQVVSGIILFLVGIATWVIWQIGDRYIASQCVRLYLLEQANLISSGMNIDQARTLMHEWTTSEALRVHMECVALCTAAYAAKYHADDAAQRERWFVTGLLHDYDYERHPSLDEHPKVGVANLQETTDVDDEMLEAIMGHNPATGVPRTSDLAKSLFAVDELAGFIVACSKGRPKGISDMLAKSVKKKLKDKAFAAAVSRADISLGIEELGVDQTEHIDFCIDAIRPEAERLGI